MRRSACLLVLLVLAFAVLARAPHHADAGKALPATNVSVSSGHIVVSTTARTSGLDTSIYITGQTPGLNFIYHSAVPATIANDAGWVCPCTAQITYRGKNGTSSVLTAPSAPFIPIP